MEEEKASLDQCAFQREEKGCFGFYQNGGTEHNRNWRFGWFMGILLDNPQAGDGAGIIWNGICILYGFIF